jgi:hypothetical protein
MSLNAQEPIHIAEAAERDAALTEFFAAVRTAAKEADAAVEDAKPALARLAATIVNRDNGQALRVRSILASLYTSGATLADVFDIMTLDWSLRKDLCLMLLAFGHGEFGYEYLRSAFEQAGDINLRWLLAESRDPRARLQEALRFARPGDMNVPRSSGERRVAQILVSLFAGTSVDLQEALQGLDQERAKLILGIVADYLAGRFDFTDDEEVRAHFG